MTATLEPVMRRTSGYGVDFIKITAETVRIAVTNPSGKVVIAEFDVPRAQALDALHHPTLYSDTVREALL